MILTSRAWTSAVGSFNKDDNGLIYDEGLLAVGVREPFVLSADTETPNNHIVPITLTMTATNGLDPSDPTQYSFESKFNLIVQRGRELPSIIDSDTVGSAGGELDTDGVVDGVVTLDESALWIVDKPVLVAKNTTLRIAPGAQVQFWSSLPDEAYTVWRRLRCKSRVCSMTGTVQPRELVSIPAIPNACRRTRPAIWWDLWICNTRTSSTQLFYSWQTQLQPLFKELSDFHIRAGGTVGGDSMPYFSAWLPGAEYYTGNGRATGGNHPGWDEIHSLDCPQSVPVREAVGNRFRNLSYTPKNFDEWQYNNNASWRAPSGYRESLFDGVAMDISGSGFRAESSVFLKNYQHTIDWGGNEIRWGSTATGIGQSQDLFLAEPKVINGRTYAFIYVHSNNYGDYPTEDLELVQEFAALGGGYLLSISSAEEAANVAGYISEITALTADEWEARYETVTVSENGSKTMVLLTRTSR